MRVFLSGMPELRLGLNDKVLFENTGREFPDYPDYVAMLIKMVKNCLPLNVGII